MYVIKRSQKLVKQGQEDTFDRTENPPKKPWRPWGDDIPASIGGGALTISGGTPTLFGGPSGGWGTEYVPLTGNWGLEWEVDVTNSSNDLYVFIGKNWANGGDPIAGSKYVVAIAFLKWTTGPQDDREDHWGVAMFLDDTNSAIDNPRKAVYEFPSSSAYVAPHSLRIKVVNYNTFICWVDGIVRWVYTIPASLEGGGFLRGPGLTSQAIRVTGDLFSAGSVKINRWYSYDYVKQPPSWSADVFYDPFTAGNGSAPAGWTTVGSNVTINSNSLGISTGLLSDGSRGAWRPSNPLSTGNMRLSVTIGGQHSVSSSQASSVIGRMNAAGNVGIALNIFSTKIYLAKFTGTLSSPGFVDYGTDNVTIANGDVLDLCFDDDECWVERNGLVLLYADGINAHSPATNTRYGLRFNRGAFVNSNSFNDFRAKVKTN